MYLLFVTLILSQQPRIRLVGSAIRVAIHAPRVAPLRVSATAMYRHGTRQRQHTGDQARHTAPAPQHTPDRMQRDEVTLLACAHQIITSARHHDITNARHSTAHDTARRTHRSPDNSRNLHSATDSPRTTRSVTRKHGGPGETKTVSQNSAAAENLCIAPSLYICHNIFFISP